MQYDFTLPAYGGMSLSVKGRFCKYKSGAGMIRVRTSDGRVVDLLPGQGIWNVDFESIDISDRSGENNAGLVLAGDFDFKDDRISGTVEVIDGGKARTLGNRAYMMFGSGTVTAGSNAHVQLWNPPGSGRYVIVEAMTYSSGNGAGGILMAIGGSPMTTFVGGGVSKRSGALTGVAQVFKGAYVGMASPSLPPFLGVNTSAGIPSTYTPKEPIVLLPSYGLNIMQTSLATDLSATFEWYEEAIL